LNEISEHVRFRQTSLCRSFEKAPLGFVDAGAAGGIYPGCLAAASLIQCTCFEPERAAAEELRRRYGSDSPFAGVTVLESALGGKAGERLLFVTRRAVNTSLLEPREELVSRYNVQGFQLDGTIAVETRPLDELLYGKEGNRSRPGEWIKLDCQGAEYEILQGATRALREQCVALTCEVEFFRMYKGQRIFSEIDLLLRKKGFQLYGLYPNYISAKLLERREADTEERIIWADAVYFKDPLDPECRKKKWPRRQIEALLLSTLLTGYYDYALELTRAFYGGHKDEAHLSVLIHDLATARRTSLEHSAIDFLARCQEKSVPVHLLAKRFVDQNRSNNSIDFLRFDRDKENDL
jgi:FkbM family methyltransferase